MPDHILFIVWLHPNEESHLTLGSVVEAYKSLAGRAAHTYLRTEGLICGSNFGNEIFMSM